MLEAKIKSNRLLNKSDISGIYNFDLDKKKKIEALATNAEWKVEQGKILKLQTYDLSLFIGRN